MKNLKNKWNLFKINNNTNKVLTTEKKPDLEKRKTKLLEISNVCIKIVTKHMALRIL